MTLLHRLASVLRWIVRRDKAEQGLDAELQAFIELSTAENVRDGLPPAEARRLAVLELGGIEQAKEQVRTYRHGGLLDEVGRDVRYAGRMFLKNPGFTATVVATLALGIGANTAIFGLIDALMLRWLPVRNPQELVQVMMHGPGQSGPGGGTYSYAIVRALSEQREIFAGVAGFSGMSGYSFEVGAPGSVDRVPAALVSGGFYDTLGLRPALGRLLVREDDEPGAPPVAVISYGYWERQLGRRVDVIGQPLRINGHPVAIVGVSPRGFVGANVGSIADITMAAATLPQVDAKMAPLLGPGNFWLRVLARPKPDLSIQQTTARLNAVWPQIAGPVIAPHWPASRRQAMAESVFSLSPGGTGWTYLREVYRKPLLVLMAVVGVVLFIACANVASLLLARAAARQREITVRLALGAGRGRIVRQLLIESTLLSAIGAGCGIALAVASGRLIVNILSTGPFHVAFDLTPNWHIIGFTTAVAVATGVLFGLAPALVMATPSPSGILRTGERVSGSRSRLLPSLVSGQVALSLVLLAGAGLFLRTLYNLQTFDPGFTAQGVLVADLDNQRTPFPRDLLESIQRMPDVASASLSTHTPLSGSIWSEPAVPAGQQVPERDTAIFVGAGPGYFATVQTHLLAGRDFTDGDSPESPAVAIVNEEYARRHFPGQNPVGQHLAADVRGRRQQLEIVGLVRNTHAAGLRSAPPATVYVAIAQLTGGVPTTLTVRATGSIARVSSAVHDALQARFPGTIEVRPMSRQVEATMVQERLMATLAGGFGLLALVLTCIGLYGLLAYGVAQRTREIGIRIALGAPRPRVIAHVLKGGTWLVLIGIALGLPAVWGASRWVESMLFGLTRTDPATIAGAIVVLIIAAQVAAYLPARRASRLDPLAALRHE